MAAPTESGLFACRVSVHTSSVKENLGNFPAFRMHHHPATPWAPRSATAAKSDCTRIGAIFLHPETRRKLKVATHLVVCKFRRCLSDIATSGLFIRFYHTKAKRRKCKKGNQAPVLKRHVASFDMPVVERELAVRIVWLGTCRGHVHDRNCCFVAHDVGGRATCIAMVCMHAVRPSPST